VEEHDVAGLPAVAQRIDHADERRQASARGDEEARPPVILKDEFPLRALDVDRVADADVPQERSECPALDKPDEELVLGEIVGR
jgi:hypothetical protein